MKREVNLLKNTIILSIGSVFPQIAAMIILPILTSYLTKEEYGSYDLITVLVSLLLPAATLQIETAAFRYLIDARDDVSKTRKIISSVLLFINFVSLIVLFVLYIVLHIANQSVKLLVCFYFYADVIYNTTGQIARGIDRNKDYALGGIIASFVKLGLIVLSVKVMHLRLEGIIMAMLLSTILAWVVLASRIRLYKYFSFFAFEINILTELLKYSWPMVPNSLSMWIMRLSDRMVVTAFMGVTWNAVYAVATKIPALLHLSQRAFTLAWQENASLVSRDRDANNYYSKMHNVLYNITGGFLCLLITLTPLLYKIFIKGDYLDSYIHIPILLIAEFFYAMATFLGGIYVAFKKTKNVGITTTIAALINLLIDLVLIRYIGIFAASGSTLISYAILYFYRLYDIRKMVSIRFDYTRYFVLMFFLCVAVFTCLSHIIVINIFGIISGIVMCYYLNKDFIQRLYKIMLNRFQIISR